MAIKKVTVKKATVKKPVMKRGGAKKPLKKAQYGQRTYQGPLNKSDIEKLDRVYPSTASVTAPRAQEEALLIRGFNPFVNGQMVSNEERESMERKDSENYMRKPKGFYKKGGTTKMQKGGATVTVTKPSYNDPYPKKLRELKAAEEKLKRDTAIKMAKAKRQRDKEENMLLKEKLSNKKKGGSTGDKKWIQKAINPAHKGYCTPMSKPTCTPKRKALAKTLKAMAKKK